MHRGHGRLALSVYGSWPAGLDWMDDQRLAVTRHPDAATLHAAVQVATTSVLLEEGIKRGEEIGHARGSVARRTSTI